MSLGAHAEFGASVCAAVAPRLQLAKWADVLVIAPLSANTLAKLASGICDNLLTCVVRAWPPAKPVVLAPAMNTVMWQHRFTTKHLGELRALGWHVVPPVEKKLACGDVGVGALAAPAAIVEAVAAMLSPTPPQPSALPAGSKAGQRGGAGRRSRAGSSRPRVLIGCCGGSGAVRVAELALHFAAFAEVQLVVTQSAQHFLSLSRDYNAAMWSLRPPPARAAGPIPRRGMPALLHPHETLHVHTGAHHPLLLLFLLLFLRAAPLAGERSSA